MAEARNYKTVDEFVKNNRHLNLDVVSDLSSNIKANDAGFEVKIGDILNSKTAKNMFADVLDTRIIVLDKNHPKWPSMGWGDVTASMGTLNGNTVIYMRGGTKTNSIVPTIIEEAQHVLQKSKGRTTSLGNSFTKLEYIANRGEKAVDMSGKNLVDFLTKDNAQLTDIYNRAHAKGAVPNPNKAPLNGKYGSLDLGHLKDAGDVKLPNVDRMVGSTDTSTRIPSSRVPKELKNAYAVMYGKPYPDKTVILADLKKLRNKARDEYDAYARSLPVD